jgi:hypothetical protein
MTISIASACEPDSAFDATSSRESDFAPAGQGSHQRGSSLLVEWFRSVLAVPVTIFMSSSELNVFKSCCELENVKHNTYLKE